SLKSGDAVELEDLTARPEGTRLGWAEQRMDDGLINPIGDLSSGVTGLRKLPATPVRVKAGVKDVKPCRGRTRVALRGNGLDISPFESGKRTFLKMPPPSKEVQEGDYPPDIGQKRTKEERIEWFLASMYCTCKVGNDICTGDFYTLSSCNPNGCGGPNAT